ncbi:hypothetical protein CDL12_11170 [Handroanthus impetiginosus]|uniref:Pentacotripeptide-repeat region of PRORP domain-containing protein n=1 Tax=Handroanthus impetiginosus TaxID=429701 RepID=A0A2G9HF80_9LAMI|nr:hypothetical protein CDL12_11170 [Handroanthus impetiginosus]
MITGQLTLDILQRKHIQRSQKFKNLCSLYHGHHLLDEIPKPPHVSVHRFMLNLLYQNRQGEALNVFKKHFQRGRERNLDFGKQVHAVLMKRGYSNHVSICNLLMSMYSKCEIVEDAKLMKMIRHDTYPNDVTFVGLIHAIIKHGMMQEGLMVRGLCIKSYFLSKINVANSFITMYGKFKLVEDCIKVFQELDYREVTSWNALISAYSLNEMYQEALQVFLLASKELPPNPYTFGSILHAIASSESISLRQGQRCHGYRRKLGLDANPIVLGALLDLHRDYESVMKYFNEMVMEGIKPDSVTFLSVLTSCGHNGMHYSCIVDILGRAGRLNEAEGFLSQISGGPGVSVLQSLLGSCRTYGNVDLAIRVSDALIAMEPNESGSYVLMSDLFAEKRKWEKAAKMRRMMRERKVMKEIFMMAELLGAEMKRRKERRSDVLSLEI